MTQPLVPIRSGNANNGSNRLMTPSPKLIRVNGSHVTASSRKNRVQEKYIAYKYYKY
jgi:hypothetical protein